MCPSVTYPSSVGELGLPRIHRRPAGAAQAAVVRSVIAEDVWRPSRQAAEENRQRDVGGTGVGRQRRGGDAAYFPWVALAAEPPRQTAGDG